MPKIFNKLSKQGSRHSIDEFTDPRRLEEWKSSPRVLHNAVLPGSDPREYIVYKVYTRQDSSQLDSDFVLQIPSPPTHINQYQPIS